MAADHRSRCWIALLLAILFRPSAAAPGDLDPTFDPGSGIDSSVSEAFVQPDGKILIRGGFTTVKGLAREWFARLNSDGSGDESFKPTFATNGQVSSFLYQKDGNILVNEVFPISGDGTIKRLNAQGSVDPSFIVRGTSDVLRSLGNILSMDTEGRILASGYSKAAGVSRIVRLNPDGEIDASFQSIGINGFVRAANVQSDGRIVIGGNFSIATAGKKNIARLMRDGTVDESFQVQTNVGAGDVNLRYAGLVLQPDGKIIVALQLSSSSVIYRLMPDGSVDPEFEPGDPFYSIYAVKGEPGGRLLVTSANGVARLNPDGTVATKIPVNGSWLYALALQNDGKIIVGGDIREVAGVRRLNLARLNPDGSVDLSFDPGAGIENASVIALQPDGRVLVGGGFTDVGQRKQAALARLNHDGSIDSAFAPELRLFVLVGPPSPFLRSASSQTIPDGYREQEQTPSVRKIVVRPDGKIMIEGVFTMVSGVERRSVAQLNADGTLDLSSPVGSAVWPGSVALQSDGKLLANINGKIQRQNLDGTVDASFVSPDVGYATTKLVSAPDGSVIVITLYSVFRLNADGSLDTTFAKSDVTCGSISSVGLQSDGKVIVGTVPWCYESPAIYRLKRDGTVDTTFSSALGGQYDVFSLLIQPDGKILAGFDGYEGIIKTGFIRLNTNGSIDPGFHVGTGTQHPFAHSLVSSIAMQPDGRILIAGMFTSFNGIARWSVARLEGDLPVLSLSAGRRLGDQVVLRWPGVWTGFQLEESEDGLSTWKPVAASPSAEQTDTILSISPANHAQFFRLRRQTAQ
jgi:uncharacterized delta-60 repeat protein